MRVISIVIIIFSVCLLAGIVELIRRGRLIERYSLFWFFSIAVLMVLSLKQDLLDMLSRRLDILYGPATLFFFSTCFILVMLIHFSVVLSRLTEQNKRLGQEIALLKAERKRD